MELALYLLPVTLGDTPIETVLPPYNKEIILGIRHFIVEDVRSARRFLKKVDKGIDIDALTFYTLNKHTSPEDISGYLKPLVEGQPMGVISEAGRGRPGSGRSGYCTTEKLESGPPGGTLFHYPFRHGFRLQRTELCLPRLSPHRTGRACQEAENAGTTRL